MSLLIDVNVTPVRNPEYVVLSDGAIRNTYDLRLRNKYGQDHWFAFSATSGAGETFVLSLEGEGGLKVRVPANETSTQRLFITAPAGTIGATTDRSEIRLWVQDLGAVDGTAAVQGHDRVHKDTVFNGKAN